MSHARYRIRRRRAVAVVEFAVVLPLVVLLLLGSVELGRGVMVQHTLQAAAQAACRVHSVRDTTVQDAIDMADQAMQEAGLTGYTIQFTPALKKDIDVHMEPVTVTLSLPYGQIAWISPTYLVNATLSASCTLPADVEDDVGESTVYDPIEDDRADDGYDRDRGDDDDGWGWRHW